jgi:hypothetical protein
MPSWFLIGSLTVALAGDPAPPAGDGAVLRGEVVDADTGRPIPCRISIRGADGSWFFPASESPQGSAVPYQKKAIGHPAIVEMHTTLSAGPFVVRLPAGHYVVTAERGKEYHPERRDVEVTAGAPPLDQHGAAGLVLRRHPHAPITRRAA